MHKLQDVIAAGSLVILGRGNGHKDIICTLKDTKLKWASHLGYFVYTLEPPDVITKNSFQRYVFTPFDIEEIISPQYK
jgi:hypothetical protein